MSAPTLHIVLEFEREPLIYTDCARDGDYYRLFDWIYAHPALQALLEAAFELQRERAA